jgi:hypothetical protein
MMKFLANNLPIASTRCVCLRIKFQAMLSSLGCKKVWMQNLTDFSNCSFHFSLYWTSHKSCKWEGESASQMIKSSIHCCAIYCSTFSLCYICHWERCSNGCWYWSSYSTLKFYALILYWNVL